MTWSVSILPKAEPELNPALERAIAEQFSGEKGERIARLLRQGTSTKTVGRLRSSAFPGSIRIRLPHDHRATVLCLPAFSQAYVTHVFPKSRDPKYRKAIGVHDARVAEFVRTFAEFMGL